MISIVVVLPACLCFLKCVESNQRLSKPATTQRDGQMTETQSFLVTNHVKHSDSRWLWELLECTSRRLIDVQRDGLFFRHVVIFLLLERLLQWSCPRYSDEDSPHFERDYAARQSPILPRANPPRKTCLPIHSLFRKHRITLVAQSCIKPQSLGRHIGDFEWCSPVEGDLEVHPF